MVLSLKVTTPLTSILGQVIVPEPMPSITVIIFFYEVPQSLLGQDGPVSKIEEVPTFTT